MRCTYATPTEACRDRSAHVRACQPEAPAPFDWTFNEREQSVEAWRGTGVPGPPNYPPFWRRQLTLAFRRVP
jgi:hypothetical protein